MEKNKEAKINLINIIKTAIITIIISFASGLMLDYFTNLAPRLLCNVRNGIPLVIDSKKVCAYIITVNNTSNKTIHDLTLNIQSSQTNLKSTDATITKGLKFNSSVEDNILDVSIPFLSKGDEFSVTVYVENQYEVNTKPVIVIRSPENFKEIDSVEQKGILSLLFNIPKNISQVIWQIMKKPQAIVPKKKNNFTTVMNKAKDAKQTTNEENREVLYENRKPSKNKKAMIIIVSVILVMITGVLGKFYFKGMSTNTSTPNVKTVVPTQSTGVAGSEGTGTSAKKGATTRTTDTSGKKGTTTGTTDTTGSKETTTGTTDTTGSKGATTGTTDATGSKDTTTGTTSTTDSKGATTGTTNTTGSKGVTTGTTTGTTGSAEGTTGTTVK